MKSGFLPLAFLCALLCATAPLASGQIAITEFMSVPRDDDDLREFFELFNFSQQPVDIANWTISDEDDDSIVLTTESLFIEPGEYLVFSVGKALMEEEYFDGEIQPNIIEYDGSDNGFVLGNSRDELILADAENEVVWSVAYMNDDNQGHATFLAEDDFSTTVWGSQDAPGIVRDGVDPASGTIGYQCNEETDDPSAGPETANGDIASPLAGFYTIVENGGERPDFRILSIVPGSVDGTFDISFESEVMESYRVEVSSDLVDFTLETEVTGSGETTELTVTPAAGSSRVFYRIRRMNATAP